MTPKEKKAAYDREYRAKNAERIKASKRAYFKATYDPMAACKKRAERRECHAEYCRQPEYVAKKREWDRQYRAREYGKFADAYLLLLDLEKEIRERATSYERRIAKGYYTRDAVRRRREACQMRKQTILRPRT